MNCLHQSNVHCTCMRLVFTIDMHCLKYLVKTTCLIKSISPRKMTNISFICMSKLSRYESKFIKTIVKEIGDKLSRTVPLSVGSNLIGIHARANKINRWIQDGPNDVGIHVIFGMSGIGKTTVAKHVYNSNFRNFEGSSFIENIRQTSEQINGIVKLQKQLLHDILNGREVRIRNSSEGKSAIEDAISCKRILLVFDDVDHMDQFDALLTMRDRFHKGSKIIITTRRAWVLKAQGITKVHYVRALNESESLTLFSLHAFRQEHPIEGYMELTEKFVRHCAGLPLALRVLGSSLFGEDVAVWESALRKVESIPNSEIVHKLRMSFDALDKHDQEVFLHIACFFIGNEKDYTVDVLDGCEFYTTIGIINLIDRCLVGIGANNKLVMHDMVRDMGRGIVRLAAEEPRKRSRLWHHNESFKVLKEKNVSNINSLCCLCEYFVVSFCVTYISYFALRVQKKLKALN